jgi:hypothetical protein
VPGLCRSATVVLLNGRKVGECVLEDYRKWGPCCW